VAEEIRAEMVANVWKILVAEGDAVAEGDTLVILESMKMEIPVLVEMPGTVTVLHVSEGDVVQEGDILAVLDRGRPTAGSSGHFDPQEGPVFPQGPA
jgi:acetyl-CoA carboxylase biotin carboxyl carrier protein